MKHTCRFCAIRDDEKALGAADSKLTEDRGYFAIPSIGALVEGWTLVVPNKHSTSLRAVYSESDFLSFVGSVAATVSEVYGPLIAFEHGPNVEGSGTGCGTDHAHLHLVPFPALTAEAIDSADLGFRSIDRRSIAEHVGNNEYLAFFPDIVGTPNRAMVALLDAPISQYFRHLIGKKLGLSGSEIDYRRSPRLNVACATAEALLPAFECTTAHG